MAVSTLLLASCSRPAVAFKPATVQNSAESLRDWRAVAGRIADAMELQDVLGPNQASFYVNVTAPDSTFLREVSGALATEILRRGGSVAPSSDGATIINLGLDLVRWAGHAGPRSGDLLAKGAGAAAGILIGDNATSISPLGFAGIAAGVGVAAELIQAMTPHTDTEVSWTASIFSAGRVLFQMREAIYVDAADAPLYLSGTTLSPLVSPGRPVLAASRQLRFVD